MQHLISQYGYLAVFVLMLAESACIPVPSELIMMFGGAMAAGTFAGAHPSLTGIFAAGVLGNVAGSYIAWAVGKYAGQVAIRRWGGRVGIREHEIDKATAWFERYGPVAVLVGRVIPVIRTFISLPAGFAEMPAGMFGVYTVLGAIPWTAALAILGYATGPAWERVANDFHGPTYAIAGILVIAVVVVIVRRRRAKATAPAAGTAAGFQPDDQGRPAGPARSAGPARPVSPTGRSQGPLPGPYAAQGSWPPPSGYQSSPDGYQPNQEGRQPNPGGYQPGPAGHQPDPAARYR